MRINFTQEITRNTPLSHLILGCLTDVVVKELIKMGRPVGGRVYDIKLTLDNHELDLHSFIKHWQNQVSEGIKDRATEIVEERFRDIEEIFCDLEERIKPEIERRLEDWERNLPAPSVSNQG